MALWGIIILLFSTLAHADQALERLCFNSVLETENAIPVLETVLIKGQDSIQREGNCLNVMVDKKRAVIFERWVETRLPSSVRSFSTINAPVDHCDMSLIKRVSRAEIITTMGSKGQIIGMTRGKEVTQGEEASSLRVIAGESARLVAGETDLEMVCIKKSDGRFLLKFSMKPNPKTIPNVYNPSEPIPVPPASAVTLKTEIELGANEEVPVAQIVKDLNKDSTTVEANPIGFSASTTVGEDNVTWHLKVL